MKNKGKTKEQLVKELMAQGQRISELELSEARLKETEKALKERQVFIESIIEGIAEPVTVINSNCEITLLNKAARQFLFGDAPPVKSLFCYACHHGKETRCDGIEIDCPTQIACESRQPVRVVHEHFRFDGEKRFLEITSSPLWSKEGTFQGIIEIARDITANKQAEEKINSLASIIETLPDALCSIDLEGNIISWNEGAEQMLGYKIEEIMGKPIAMLIPEELVQSELDHCINLLNTGGSFTGYESVRIAKNGKIVPVEMTAVAIKDRQQKIVSYASIMRDISERKKLEEQLLHAQKMEAVGQLAGGIAHDFNNILSAILGYASILQMKMKEDDPLRINVEQILTSSENAANLTKSLLTFSRKQVMNLRNVHINDIIMRIETLLLRTIGEDIELKTILADTDLMVMADSGQIELVLMNLCTNARDAMPNGGILTIKAERAALGEENIRAYSYGKPGDYALISVADTGLGMDEKTRERIFEPFFTTKGIGKGTGLGLSIVYGIIEQHDGYINVYSEEREGTTFKIYLPAVESVSERTRQSEITAPKGGAETILVAEDDAGVRELTKNVLEEFGYTVVEAVDGEDAIKAFIENRDSISLLILDVLMPKKNGVEVYEEIMKIRPEMKTIFTSGYTKDLIFKKGILEEGLNFLMKPILPTELLKKVREEIDKK